LTEQHDTPADECYRCGYDLRGVADEQPCPECGLLAVRSRRPTDELHDTRPGWLRRLAWGLRLMLLAVLVLPAWPAAVALIEQQAPAVIRWGPAGPNVPQMFAFGQHARQFVGDLAVLLFAAGIFLMTSREGYAPADRADRSRRRLLRLATLPLVLAMSVSHFGVQMEVDAMVNGTGWGRPHGPIEWAGLIAFLLLTIGMVPLPILLMVQLRSLAKRARHAHLAEHSVIVGVGNAVTLLYVPVFLFIWDNAESWGFGTHWTGRSHVALGLMLVLALLSTLFVLWNLYLLVRFSIAFARASRALRNQWRRDDRSAMPASAAPG
jgi:hypothetical protein